MYLTSSYLYCPILYVYSSNSIRTEILVSYASMYSIDMIMNALNKLGYLNMLFETTYIHPFRNKIKGIEDKALHKKIVRYFNTFPW